MLRASSRLQESRAIVRTFFQNNVVRSLGVLVGGTVVAHMITALAMPISTRLFSPADFNAAAAFSSLLGIFSVVACLRFDLAIALPDNDEEAANLLALSLFAAVAVAIFIGIALAILPESILQKLNQPRLSPWLWLLPFGVLLGGTYLALQMWFVRTREFSRIARSRIYQSFSAVGGQITLGIAGYTPLGLIVGQLLNYCAGSISLLICLLRRDRTMTYSISLRTMTKSFVDYRRFPIFSTWEALANAGSIHIPMLLIAALAQGPEAGYLTLAIFLLQMPMALLGNSIGQLYVAHAPAAHRDGQIADYTLATITNLARLTIGPIVIIAIISPHMFGLIFGSEWTRAGVLAAWMAPWFFMQLLAVPVSTALHIVNRQSAAMALQVAGLLLRLGAVVVAGATSPGIISESYAISGLLFYALYLYVVCRNVGIGLAEVLGALGKGIPFAVVGGLVGAVVVWAASTIATL